MDIVVITIIMPIDNSYFKILLLCKDRIDNDASSRWLSINKNVFLAKI